MGTNEKLARLSRELADRPVKVLIIGLGSVGNYLLTYLLDDADEALEVAVAGRNGDKLRSDVNIAKVAALIRGKCRTDVPVFDGVDLDDIQSIRACIEAYQPDIIVNSSRVYSGLKYGSISWETVRAYDIWAPLSVRYVRNIMMAYSQAESDAIVINTSYSDATIPWLKSAGKAYPDFGSGNINHIVPRLRMAAAKLAGISDFWNVQVDYATAHFHDVVISKEGHDEGLKQLLTLSYEGKPLDVEYDELLKLCAIPMPVDQKRNMMNASSNYEIIRKILSAVRDGERTKFFSPGALGEIGGYPVIIDGEMPSLTAVIDDSVFAMDEMRQANRASIALDGIEDVSDGNLVYTDKLIEKAEAAFGVRLPKRVPFDEIDKTSEFLIDSIIRPELAKRGR